MRSVTHAAQEYTEGENNTHSAQAIGSDGRAEEEAGKTPEGSLLIDIRKEGRDKGFGSNHCPLQTNSLVTHCGRHCFTV